MTEKNNYYLAVDFGASSGRHILCHAEGGRLITEEVYRFENGAVSKNGTLCWEIDRLFNEIINGMKKCAAMGKIPVSMGIDTWGVDFVLIDKDGKRIGDAVSYRDGRTEKAVPYVEKIIGESELYSRTGILKAPYNTVYQLAAVKTANPEYLENTAHLLMLPDYFNYLLTGKLYAEYTEATTSGLINATTKDWDTELISQLGLPQRIFCTVKKPGEKAGRLLPEIAKAAGFDTEVILTASHDTASAVAAIPYRDNNAVYISSGTWSLMGIETDAADCSEKCRRLGLSNEGGLDGINCLKNIMGLWMIQQVRHEYNDEYSFAELCDMAEKSDIDSTVDCNDSMFLSPESMRGAIDEYCRKYFMKVPENAGDYAKIIYTSLAKCYSESAEQIEKLTGKKYNSIHIIGGGSNAGYLNRLTAEYSKKTVCAGPSEATALGNIAVQMIATGGIKNIDAFKKLVSDTFEIKTINTEETNI